MLGPVVEEGEGSEGKTDEVEEEDEDAGSRWGVDSIVVGFVVEIAG